MHVMDMYCVKQPKNITKVKMKEHKQEIGKKRILEKRMKYILLPLFCL